MADQPLNCWEFRKCGNNPMNNTSGKTCPCAKTDKLNGVNRGFNGGRACWVISDTLCTGKPMGKYAMKLSTCLNCDFFKTVNREEGENKARVADMLIRLSE